MRTLPAARAFILLLVVAPVFAAPVVSVPGLVGYWRLDEAATPAADDSGNGNAGTWTNGGAAGAAVPAGPPGIGFTNTASHSFDGVDDYVEIGTPAALNITTNITVSAWVNFTTDTTEKKAVAKWSDTPNNYCWLLTIYDTGGPAAFFVQPATGGMIGADTGGAVLSTGTWYHLMGTYDGANVRMFLNGVQTAAAPLTGAINTGAAPIRVGAGSGGTAPPENPYPGLVDDVRIYNYALTPIEVATVYAGALPGAFTLTATGGAGQNNLSWTPSVNAASYTIGRSTVMGGPYPPLTTFVGLSYTDTAVTVGTTYYYQITARNPLGSAMTLEASATPFTPPPREKDGKRCGCSSVGGPSGWTLALGLALALLAIGLRRP